MLASARYFALPFNRASVFSQARCLPFPSAMSQRASLGLYALPPTKPAAPSVVSCQLWPKHGWCSNDALQGKLKPCLELFEFLFSALHTLSVKKSEPPLDWKHSTSATYAVSRLQRSSNCKAKAHLPFQKKRRRVAETRGAHTFYFVQLRVRVEAFALCTQAPMAAE